MRRLASRGGLTLLELLVILVLVATLFGIAAIFIVQQRENARRLHCQHYLRTLGNGIQAFHDSRPKTDRFLPPSRLADGYATWVVIVTPYMSSDHALQKWDLSRPVASQPAELRDASLAEMFCPSRPRTRKVGASGALGDYACVAGNGQTDWTGLQANGPMIEAEVLEKDGDHIKSWRGRTSFASITRGLSYTLLLGEKQVPASAFGQVELGDAPIYDGRYPFGHARIGGPGHGLAADPEAPGRDIFGSYHPGVCQFLYADQSVRGITLDINESVLGEMTTRSVIGAP